MKHADALTKRILLLEGLPNFQEMNRLRIGENVPEILQADLDLEMEAMPTLKEAITYCEEMKDYNSRELPEDILDSEEEHVDWLEPHLGLIDKIGLPNYLQSQAGKDD